MAPVYVLKTLPTLVRSDLKDGNDVGEPLLVLLQQFLGADIYVNHLCCASLFSDPPLASSSGATFLAVWRTENDTEPSLALVVVCRNGRLGLSAVAEGMKDDIPSIVSAVAAEIYSTSPTGGPWTTTPMLTGSDDLVQLLCKSIGDILGPSTGNVSLVGPTMPQLSYCLDQTAFASAKQSHHPAEGAMVIADESHAPLLAKWTYAFFDEGVFPGLTNQGKTFEDYLPQCKATAGRGHMFLWTLPDGTPVTMLGLVAYFNLPSGGKGCRISSVYTPPDHRRKGYSSSLLIAACDHLINVMGLNELYLFTDAENPASNTLYKSIGFGSIRPFRATVMNLAGKLDGIRK
eukprot:comp18056_c0_seq1/m.18612 comp18056_c0_seq1/g.18612  ORF comp18056_c0_seq1/g.18612 comp18056_c0_seq1/m.18612 type:complete len:346 (-) comp18056_c0_seq1:173-1210(-)